MQFDDVKHKEHEILCSCQHHALTHIRNKPRNESFDLPRSPLSDYIMFNM